MSTPFVQKTNSGAPPGSASSAQATLNGQAAGNMNLVTIAYGNGSATTIAPIVTGITSSAGNTYSVCTAPSKFISGSTTAAVQIQSFYAPQIKAGTETITVNLSGPVNFLVIGLYEYNITGASPIRSVAVTPTQTGTNTGTPGPITFGAANANTTDLVVGIGVLNDPPFTAGSGFTTRDTISTMFVEDSVAAATGSIAASGTAGSQVGSVGQTLVFINPGAAPPPTYLMQKINSGAPPASSASLQVTLNSQVAGHLNFLSIVYGSGSTNSVTQTVTGVTSSAGNNYVPCSSPSQWVLAPAHGLSAALVQSYYAPNIKAGTDTVTVNLSAAANFFVIGLYELNVPGTTPLGSAGVTPTQTGSDGTGGVVTPVPVSGTLGYSGDLVIGIGSCTDGPNAAGAGFSFWDTVSTMYVEEMYQNPSLGTVTAAATGKSQYGNIGQTIVFRTPATIAAQFPTSGEARLNGAASGSSGTPSNLVDGNSWTLWGAGPGPQWAQIDAGTQVRVSRIRFSTVKGGEDGSIGATFAGSNDPNFVTGITTFYTVPGRLQIGTLRNEVIINSPTAFRYYRWTTTAFGLISDLDIYVFASGVSGAILTPGDVVLSPSTGNFDLPTYVTLSLINPSPIYYTLDGTSPNSSSTLYTGPFVVGHSCVLNAAGILPGNTGRVLTRIIHIGNTEVSIDDVYDSRNYKLWALNGHIMYDPVSGYWYRYGISGDTPLYYGYGYSGNSCYRSADLRNWEYRSIVLGPLPGTADTTTNIRTHVGIHVGYNPTTSKYVCWADSYDTPASGNVVAVGKTVWTSASPEGPFTLISTITNFPGAGSTAQGTEGDSFLFVENDGVTAYFYSTCSQPGNPSNLNSWLFCAQLTPDWLNFTANTAAYPWSNFSNSTREAPCVNHVGNVYFLLHSNTTGFNSSDCRYATSSSPLGPWTGNTLPFQPAPGGTPDLNTSYDSQNWYIVQIPGRQNGYVYHGDRYDCPSGTLFANVVMTNWKRIRLPVIFSGATMTINWLDSWSFDAQMPSSSLAPAAASNLSVSSTGTASWTNNEPKAVQFFVDTAPDPSFSTGVASYAVPLGQTNVTGVPAAAVYRIRAKNASGSSFSASASAGAGAAAGNPPFLPISFPPGPPTVPAWESGPTVFLPYNGATQTAKINAAVPIPGTGITPAWELGPGPADPNLSNIKVNSSATGYGQVSRGTINAGTNTPVTPGAAPAQVRFYVGADGKLYARENQTSVVYQIGAPSTPPVPVAVAQPAPAPVTLAETPSGELLYGPSPGGPLHTIEEPKPTYQGSFYGQQSPLEQWWWNGTGQPTDDWIKHP